MTEDQPNQEQPEATGAAGTPEAAAPEQRAGARGPSAETGVLTANTAFYNAFEAGDLDLMAAVWLPEPDPVCIHPGNAAISGYSEMMRAWAMIFANTPYIQFFLTDVQARVDGDVAYVTCTENVLSSGEGAPEEGFAGGKALATNVFRKTSSGWRLWIHHASPVLSSGGRSEEAQ